MQMTTTTHPPAGATALLAAVSPEVYVMGWYYLPVVFLSSTLVLISALLVNNVQRRYPVFWFTPTPPAVAPAVPKSGPPLALADRDDGDLEKGVIGTPASSD
ncbi:hypothetical protein F5050DRAFT_1773890 [Lentinula boryana]|uniref:HPP transmembrane region domain-containing protein n=1 Tax=Lentinula boryana TaxID=40481 RepID=A0ABQ8Q7K8_9AGAR|nr:hypothetical protein F5050DRAFT_1773890 [Lentinula boryana]